ncbi:hypothetical protein [Photobacterium leiognathi]|uniref:hypothetical protein n=1 Tax=Photobacterium leiognathi TaxID=553611 RepID=UPI002981177F|nr:hypothetical protein [Photobacterium leiognathi]
MAALFLEREVYVYQIGILRKIREMSQKGGLFGCISAARYIYYTNKMSEKLKYLL